MKEEAQASAMIQSLVGSITGRKNVIGILRLNRREGRSGEMKKVMVTKTVFFSILYLMVLAPLALAGPITGTLEIDRIQGYYEPYNVAQWPGGEFYIYLKDGYTKPLYYSPAAMATKNDKIGFESFCLERGESISVPGTYNYTINTKAINGGVGPDGDPISAGTAYLYSQFAKGVLLDYNYADTAGSGRADSAKLLQKAIWYLEDEIGGEPNNFYVALAVSKLGSEELAKADNNGQYAVMALNITKADGTLRQDQLIYTPEPASVLLLGIGILGAALLRRKYKTA